MAELQGLIPPQQFEVVRDRIAQVLSAEIANQVSLGLTELANATKVWIDRSVSFEPNEMPAANVSLGTGEYISESQRSSDGKYTFYVDMHVQAREDQGAGIDADLAACVTLDRFIGVVRSILKYSGYRTLGFPPPSLSRTTITKFEKGQADNQDANTSKMARIEFVVWVPETVELNTAIPVGSILTQVKLGNTDKGYRWEDNFLTIFVLDSNRLAKKSIFLGWIKFDLVEFLINLVFATLLDAVTYLNGPFKTAHPEVTGLFFINAGIYYTNPEKFETAEVMSILETNMLRIQMGDIDDPSRELNVPVIEVPNSPVITLPELGPGVEVLLVQVANTLSEPITAFGWTHNANTETLSFPADNYPQNTHIYVLTKQTS